MKLGNKKLLIPAICLIGVVLICLGAFLTAGTGSGQLYLLTALGCLLISGILFLKWVRTRK